jgi:hypothetical protein
MTDSVSFSSFELIVNGALPDVTFLNNAFSSNKTSMTHEEFIHQIECEIIEDRFYWFYSNFGKAMPHRDIVIDIPSGTELENPRTTQQVEPNDQLFAIYDSSSSLFYISNLKKKGFLKEFLSQFTDEEVIIKNIYKNINDFIDVIKTLETIKFTGSRDLFNREGDLFSSIRDIFGYGEPEEFSIEAKYRTSMKDALKCEILRLAGYQSAGDIKTMVCIGKDERGFEAVFNANNFINKISIPRQKDNQLLFPSEDVRTQVIIKLREMANVYTS